MSSRPQPMHRMRGWPMARKTSMRMGSLNLLILVIALSLAVMGVLSLVTAQASDVLSEKQAQTTKELYAEEAAAQQALADIDGILALVREGQTRSARMVSAVSEEASRICEDIEALPASQEVGITAELTALTRDELQDEGDAETISDNSMIIEDVSTSGASSSGSSTGSSSISSSALERCVGGCSLALKTPSGLDLQCLIGFHADGTYTIFRWETSRSWNEAIRNQMLWTGSQQ